MTKTKQKQRTTETVERELVEVRSRVAEMRSELRDLSKSLQISWDGVRPETLERVASADTKRTALPHAIAAGEVRELELERDLARLQLPLAEAEITRRYEAMQEAQEERQAAEANYNEKNYSYGDAQGHRRDLVVKERRLGHEIAERKAAAQRGREALAAPVVRSLWQQQTRDGSAGWWKW